MGKIKNTLFLMFFSALSVVISCDEIECGRNSKRPRTLTQSGVLVHLTSVFPKAGKLMAGARIVEPGCAQYMPDHNILPNTRPTLHFTIDKAFTAHEGNPENYPYAILIPVGSIDRSRLQFGHHEDVIVVGNVDFLAKDAIVLAPKKRMKNIKKVADKKMLEMIHPYSNLTCRQAVNEYLQTYYRRLPIESIPYSLEFFESHPIDEIIKVQWLYSEGIKYILSKKDLNPFCALETCPTYSFLELGENLKRFAPIDGPGFMWITRVSRACDSETCFQYEPSEEDVLALVDRKIIVNGNTVEAKEYFKETLGLELEWTSHENTFYNELEIVLNQLFILYNTLPYKINAQNDEIIKYCAETLQQCFEESFIPGTCEGLDVNLRSIFQKNIEKLAPQAYSKLQFFYDRELAQAKKITDPIERDNVINYVESFYHSNNDFIEKIKELSIQLANGNDAMLNALHREIRTKLPELEVY